MANENVNDLKKAIVEATQRAEAAEAQVASLKAEQANGNIFADIINLADMGYNAVNARALAAVDSDDPLSQGPAGQAPELRPHMAFKVCFEQILDGIDKAINGFDYGNGKDRNGRQRHFNGLVDQVDFYKGRLERLRVAGDMVVVVEGQKPRLTEAGQFSYDRIVELSEMITKLRTVAESLEQAHHLVSPDEQYLPFAERMDKIAAEKEKRAKATAELPDLFAKMGLEIPKV